MWSCVRRAVAALALAGLAITWLPPAAAAVPSPPPSVSAAAGVLYDPAAQQVLWAYRPDLQLPVASLTKLMTAFLALHEPASTRVTAGADAVTMPQTDAGLVAAHTYTLDSLLPLLVVRSANDVAVAIADALGGSVSGFAADMNAEAAALGLADTHYVNPNGLDAAGQHSSARDVATLAGFDMEMPVFGQLAALRAATLPGGGTFGDVNPFLGAYPGADGVKTGFTSTAGFCLAASATRGGRLLIAVVLNERSWAKAVADASALLNWGYAQPPLPAPAHPAVATMIPLVLPAAAAATANAPEASPPADETPASPTPAAAPTPEPAPASPSAAAPAPAPTPQSAPASPSAATQSAVAPAPAARSSATGKAASQSAAPPALAEGTRLAPPAPKGRPAAAPAGPRAAATHNGLSPRFGAWIALAAAGLMLAAVFLRRRGSQPGA